MEKKFGHWTPLVERITSVWGEELDPASAKFDERKRRVMEGTWGNYTPYYQWNKEDYLTMAKYLKGDYDNIITACMWAKKDIKPLEEKLKNKDLSEKERNGTEQAIQVIKDARLALEAIAPKGMKPGQTYKDGALELPNEPRSVWQAYVQMLREVNKEVLSKANATGRGQETAPNNDQQPESPAPQSPDGAGTVYKAPANNFNPQEALALLDKAEFKQPQGLVLEGSEFKAPLNTDVTDAVKALKAKNQTTIAA